MADPNAYSVSSADDPDHDYSQSNSSYNQYQLASNSDEISQLLRQILFRSSPSLLPETVHAELHAPPGAASRIDASSHGFLAAGLREQGGSGPSISGLSGKAQTHVSSSSVGPGENEMDDDDFESEEVVVDEPPSEAASQRTSSKRSRAAEVHNLSEKRRRSRINEKMKALQSLIPNSNKTDKASMLDEAIEYLKQLQLQVQMLTMRNGLSLHPLSLPGFAAQSGASFNEENKYSRVNAAGMIHGTSESSIDTKLNHLNQFSYVRNVPSILSTESPIHCQLGASHCFASQECRAADGPRMRDVVHKMNMGELEAGIFPNVTVPYDASRRTYRSVDQAQSEDLS